MGDVNLTLTLHGAKDLRLEDRLIPEPGPGEVQISVRSVGICGSDLRVWQTGGIGNKKAKAPLVLGHEPSGVVTKIGDGVNNVKVGDRVAVEPNKPCGACYYCRRGPYNMCTNNKYLASPPTDGALTRYFCHSAQFVYRLPDNMSFDEGSLVQPTALGFYACERGGVGVGHYLLVSGAGPLGMSVVLAAKARGVAKICVTDLIQNRLDYIKKLGADVAVLVSEEETPENVSQRVLEAVGRDFDVSIECSGSPQATSAAIYSTRPRGVICQIGFGTPTVNIPLLAATFKELHIRGLCFFSNNYETVIEAISSGKVDVKQLITHRFRLEDALEAFNTALRREGVKVIIDCQRRADSQGKP